MEKDNLVRSAGTEFEPNNEMGSEINAPSFHLQTPPHSQNPTQFKSDKEKHVLSFEGLSNLNYDSGDAHPPTDNLGNQQLSQAKPPIFQLKSSSSYGMPDETLNKMSNSFGTDFSDVNIHSDSKSATDAGALAYTQGNDIHFAPGQYDPASQSGQELLGHELTHVQQQREGRVQANNVVNGMPLNDDKSLEDEADAGGRKAVQMKNSERKSKNHVQYSTIQLYRAKNEFEFGGPDGLEESFSWPSDKEKKPWIQNIEVEFDKWELDLVDRIIPFGTATANYYKSKRSSLSMAASGGSKELGLTKAKKNAGNWYLQGEGFSDAPNAKEKDGPTHQYVKRNANGHRYGSMDYAIFYDGGRAIHSGFLALSSHGCIHIADRSSLQNMNYHTVLNHTIINVKFVGNLEDIIKKGKFSDEKDKKRRDTIMEFRNHWQSKRYKEASWTFKKMDEGDKDFELKAIKEKYQLKDYLGWTPGDSVENVIKSLETEGAKFGKPLKNIDEALKEEAYYLIESIKNIPKNIDFDTYKFTKQALTIKNPKFSIKTQSKSIFNIRKKETCFTREQGIKI